MSSYLDKLAEIDDKIDKLKDDYLEVDRQIVGLSTKRTFIKKEIKSLENYHRSLTREWKYE